MRRVFSSRDVGKLVGADPSSVNRWIDSGRLKAYRTPGGHRRVLRHDLVTFLDQLGIPHPEELQDGARSLLLVDGDEASLRTLRKGLLRLDRGLDVQLCTSPLAALIQVGARQPNAVLLDLGTAGADGIEVCRRIRDSSREVMVIAAAARTTAQLEARAREAGAQAVLTKPVRPAAVMEILRPGQAVED